MQHPFTWLPPLYRWALLAALFVGAVAFAIVLKTQGKPLDVPAVPGGILSYEFAWGRARAESILAAWGPLKDTATRQLLLDFGFLVFYPLFLSLACAMLAESLRSPMAAVGVFISWAVLVAGPLDAVENVALLRMINVGAGEGLARLAGWCAGIKFLLVYSSLGYLALQGVGVLFGKLRAS